MKKYKIEANLRISYVAESGNAYDAIIEAATVIRDNMSHSSLDSGLQIFNVEEVTE